MISAINLILTYKLESVDCLIMHPNMKKYKEIIACYFDGEIYELEKMYDVTLGHCNILNYIVLVKRILKKKQYIRNNEIMHRGYKRLFVPSDDTSCRVIYDELMKNNDIELSLFDDGVGTYSGYIYKKKSILKQMVYKLLYRNMYYENLKYIYCYRPEIIKLVQNNSKLKKIEYYNLKDAFKPYVDNASEQYIGKKVIFFDQGFKGNEAIIKTLDKLSSVFGKQNIIVKKHPRVDSGNIYKGFEISNDGLPFEAIFSVLDCSRAFLVAYSSTACITPFLLGGYNNKILILQSLENKEKNNIEVNLFEYINEQAKENVVYLPRNYAELENIIFSCKDEVGTIRK